MDNKCYRCETKTQCSQNYPARTPNPVGKKTQKVLSLKTSSLKESDKPIRCCIKCISPPSREPLHNNEVFSRPENMLLNYIVDKLDSTIDTEKTFNVVEDTDEGDKYDLLIKKDSRYILVEIDEKEHFLEQQFFDDRKREKRFWTNYGTEHGVLRIRAGEDPTKKVSQYACISRKGGRGGGCSVTNKNLFEMNMNNIVNHIKTSLTRSSFIKHGYIELFNNLDVQDFKKTFSYKPSTSNQESSYTFQRYPNGLGVGIEDLTSKMNNIKISSSGSCGAIKKDGKKCTNKCRENGKCGNHGG